MELRVVGLDEPLLDKVRDLGRSLSKTLGFLPLGAFRSYAAQEQVVAAVEGGEVLGYVIWRSTRLRSMLVHVAVAPTARGRGIARSLVDEVISRSTQLVGVGAWCRADFEANRMWPALGFTVVREKPGRSSSGTTLKLWWKDAAGGSLLPAVHDRPLVVLDTNVVTQLTSERPDDAIKALEADWLAGELRIAVSSAVLGEVARDSDESRRRRNQKQLEQFDKLETNVDLGIESNVRTAVFGSKHLGLNDTGDITHVAAAVAAGASAFVTTDTRILRANETIRSLHGMSVMRPYELVRFVDRLSDLAEFKPKGSPDRIASIAKADERDLAAIVSKALDFGAGETKFNLIGLVKRLSMSQQGGDLFAVREGDKLVAAVGFVPSTMALNVDLLRIFDTKSPNAVATFVLRWLIQRSLADQRPLLRIRDTSRPAFLTELSAASGFIASANALEKISITGCFTPQSLQAWIDGSPQDVKESAIAGSIRTRLRNVPNAHGNAIAIERTIWPAHLTGTGMRSFVVPIRPVWARELFDYELAEQGLFAPMRDLLMNNRNVYYKSARGMLPDAPCRLIWYVSYDDRFETTSAVRALSLCEKLTVGEARRLYTMYRELGVYDWTDVLHLARGSARAPIAALEFTQVEGLRRPLPLRLVKEIVASKMNRGFHVRSVSEINDAVLEEIHKRGTNVN